MLNDERSDMTMDASQLTLKLYTSTVIGEGENEERIYEAVGDEIRIELKNN